MGFETSKQPPRRVNMAAIFSRSSMKRILSIFLCLTLISADGGILMDINSGAVLFEKNSHEPYYPASITKILTALIVIENCGLDETVTFSNTAVNSLEPNSSILGARAGDTLSVRDCLYALLLQSANEVANALVLMLLRRR